MDEFEEARLQASLPPDAPNLKGSGVSVLAFHLAPRTLPLGPTNLVPDTTEIMLKCESLWIFRPHPESLATPDSKSKSPKQERHGKQ